MKLFFRVLPILLFLPIGLFAASGEAVQLAEETTGTKSNVIAEIAGKFGVNWPTLIAQMINFAIVAAVLYQFAIKPIAVTLDERQRKIAEGLQYAEEMKTRLVETERERAEKIKEAAAEAQRILGESREQAKEMIERKTREAATQAENILRKAAEATEMERQNMLAEVRREMTHLVVTTSGKVLGRVLSDAEKISYSESAAEELAKARN